MTLEEQKAALKNALENAVRLAIAEGLSAIALADAIREYLQIWEDSADPTLAVLRKALDNYEVHTSKGSILNAG
jgi:hypothetical protein